VISRAEFEADDKTSVAYRAQLQGVKFDQLDVNKDNSITDVDFAVLQKAKYDAILDAYNRGDEDWIWKNYYRVSIPWLKEHFALEANKDRLPRLNLPIYIFHGEEDGNCSVQGAYDVKSQFDKAGKKERASKIAAENVFKFFISIVPYWLTHALSITCSGAV